MEIRKCTTNEIAAVEKFYNRLIKFMIDNNADYPKWKYKPFPPIYYIEKAVQKNSQFICIEGEKIIGAFVLTEESEEAYKKAAWTNNLKIGEYLILHSVAVAPDFQRCGIGKKIVNYCVNYAKNKNYFEIRLDIVPNNFPAKKLYESCNFKFAGEIDLERNISEIPKFCLYERNLYE